MNLNPSNTKIIGYASPSIGNVWYPKSEQYRPMCLRMHDIVETPDGPRVVIGVLTGSVALAEVDGPDAVIDAEQADLIPGDYRIANRPDNPDWKGLKAWFDETGAGQ
jgi:hypothetical protein